MPEEESPKSIKHQIKVWSQAGATLVAAVIGCLIIFEVVTWTDRQVVALMGVYAAVMMVLRQMFSVTE